MKKKLIPLIAMLALTACNKNTETESCSTNDNAVAVNSDDE